MILTSVGSHDRPLGFGHGGLLDEMTSATEDLKALVVAEVGGVCIRRPNLTSDKIRQFKRSKPAGPACARSTSKHALNVAVIF